MKKRELKKVIRNLMWACTTLMDEVPGQKATKWGIVNAAMVAGEAALKILTAREEGAA